VGEPLKAVFTSDHRVSVGISANKSTRVTRNFVTGVHN